MTRATGPSLCSAATPRAEGVKTVFSTNGRAKTLPEIPHPVDSRRTFAGWLHARLRATVPATGTFVTLAGTGRRAGGPLRGVVEATYPHGFLIRGPHYRTFVAYRDLYCADGHARVLEPLSFALDVDRTSLEAKDRLPRGSRSGPAAPRLDPAELRRPRPLQDLAHSRAR